MIDNFALLLTHSLLLLTAWKFIKLADRDPDESQQKKAEGGWTKKR